MRGRWRSRDCWPKAGRYPCTSLKFALVFSDAIPDMKKPEVIDLNESIRRTAELAQNQIRPSQVQLDLKLSSKSPRVLATPAELSQALLNVVQNAIDAIAGAGSGTVRITSAVIRNHVVVSIIDDAPTKETDARQGLGISRSIFRKIGGDMWMSCAESCGTTFIIELPSASLN